MRKNLPPCFMIALNINQSQSQKIYWSIWAHHADEFLDDFDVLAALAAAPAAVPSVVFDVLWSFKLVFVSFLIDGGDLVLKKSKNIRPMLQIPFMFCCCAHLIHTFARRFRHIIDGFMRLMQNIVGTFANCICNLFDLKFFWDERKDTKKS